MNLGADLEECCEPQAWIPGEVVKLDGKWLLLITSLLFDYVDYTGEVDKTLRYMHLTYCLKLSAVKISLCK